MLCSALVRLPAMSRKPLAQLKHLRTGLPAPMLDLWFYADLQLPNVLLKGIAAKEHAKDGSWVHEASVVSNALLAMLIILQSLTWI